jgi:ketosteroid isomerase-like protein
MAAKKTTEQVLVHHMESLAAGKLDAIMEDYTDDSVLITSMGIAKGKNEIRENFKMITGMITPEISASMAKNLKQEIVGEYAMITYSAPPVLTFGTDTFHVHNGKIAAQTAAVLMKT